MKKRLLAILLATVMVFSLTACEPTDPAGGTGTGASTTTGTGAEGTEPNEGTTPDEGTIECVDTDEEGSDGFNKCDNCGEWVWEGKCAKKAKVKDFNEKQGEQGDKEVIRLYTFTDETVDMLNFFLEQNPTFSEKNFIVLEYNTNAEAHRLAVKLNIGKDDASSVDLFVADVDYAIEFAKLDGTASVDELDIEITESEYYPYTLDLMRKDGKIMGLSHQSTPGAMYYRADIAAEVFGISSEDEMQALVKDWDSFVAAAQKLTDTKPEVKMLAGADELKRNFLNARDEGWVNSDKELVIDYDTITEFVETNQALKDMGALKIAAGDQQWGSSWTEGMSDGKVFAYFGSTWYLHYTLKDNAKDTKGKWGMIPGPQDFYWGGTYWFGSKVAAGKEGKKAAINQIIEYFCVNDDEVIQWMEKTGDFPAKKAVAKTLEENYDGNDFFLYKTNHYAVFSKIADDIDITKNITEYDDVMNTVFNSFINYVFSDNKTQDEAIEKMKEDAAEKIDGIKIH